MSESDNRELDKLHTPATDLHTPDTYSLHTLEQQLKNANNRINELSALLFQILDQVESDLFNDQVSHITRQNLIRIIKQRIRLTPEILDIVNKSKEQEQPVNQ